MVWYHDEKYHDYNYGLPEKNCLSKIATLVNVCDELGIGVKVKLYTEKRMWFNSNKKFAFVAGFVLADFKLYLFGAPQKFPLFLCLAESS
jgi:hypothetical protein